MYKNVVSLTEVAWDMEPYDQYLLCVLSLALLLALAVKYIRHARRQQVIR